MMRAPSAFFVCCETTTLSVEVASESIRMTDPTELLGGAVKLTPTLTLLNFTPWRDSVKMWSIWIPVLTLLKVKARIAYCWLLSRIYVTQ